MLLRQACSNFAAILKIRLFRAGGVIGAFLLLSYLSIALLPMPVRLALLADRHGPLGRFPVGFRAKTRRGLARLKNRQFCKIPAKPAPAHLPTMSAAFAGIRKPHVMEANEHPAIEAFMR